MGRSARSGVSASTGVPLVVLAVVLGVMAAVSPAVGADESRPIPLELRVLPGSVHMQVGESTVVELLVHNPADSPAEVVTVDVVTPPPFRVSRLAPPPPTRVPAGGYRRLQVRLSTNPGFESAELALIAEYRPVDQPEAELRVATATVAMTAGKAATAPELVIVNPPEKIGDGQKRAVLIRVTNGTPFRFRDLTLNSLDSADTTLRLEGTAPSPFVTCDEPTDPALEPDGALTCLEKLDPGASQLLSVQLSVDDSVRTGKQRIGVSLVATRAAGGAGVTMAPTTVIGTADVELTVFGIDALSPFGLGTLFVVPGVVAVILFLLLNRWLYPKSQKLPDTVGVTDLRALPFVVVGALTSYALVLLIWGRDLTVSVGTPDVWRLFFLGLGLGCAVWIIMAIIWHRRIGRKLFSVEDSPETVLERLDANKSSMQLPVVTHASVPHRVLGAGKDGTVLMAPEVTYHFRSADPAGPADRTAFRTALDNDDPMAVLAAARRANVSLKWRGAKGVVAGKADAIPEATTTAPLIDWED